MRTRLAWAWLLAALLLCRADLPAQSADDQWLIVGVTGQWKVTHRGQRTPQPLGKYDVVTRASRLTCTSKAPCRLTYYSPIDQKALPLALSNGVVVGKAPAAVPRAKDFAERLALKAVPAGRRKSTPTCHGDLAMVAPVCGETIDPAGFSVRWSSIGLPPGSTLTLLVGATDSSERRRWNSLQVGLEEFSATTLSEYLRRLQLPDKPTDLTIRVMRSAALDAVRLVRLPSRAEDEELRRKLAESAAWPDLPRTLAMLEEYMAAGMWSRAADVSRQLLRDASDSVEIQKYALVGFCRSGDAGEIVRLRAALKRAGVTGLCEEGEEP